MKSARLVCAESLIRAAGGGYSQLVLDSAIRKNALPPRDAAFASSLFYGTLERMATLDIIIGKYCTHKLSVQVRVVLQMAVYQLLYMDSVPDSAAVNEAVEMTRTLRQSSASKMVNGVLRAFLRDNKAIPKGNNPIEQLQIDYSCSIDIAELLTDWVGLGNAKVALERTLGRPVIFARVNTLKTNTNDLIASLLKEGVEATAASIPNCIEINGDFANTEGHKTGLFSIEDISSQKAALLLMSKKGDRVLDVCSAPGSKAFLIAQEMENTGELVCCDISDARLNLVEKGAQRLGIDIIKTKAADGSVFDETLIGFDKVFCDVPCSGIGVIRRKPELKYRDKKAVEQFPTLQYKILENASNYTVVGGTLVYSTCTLNPEENEKILTRFLDHHKNFTPYPFDGDNFYRTNMVGEEQGDGFFMARIKRES